MAFGDIIRFPLFAIRLLQWAFIVIALGLFSKFIERDNNGAHIIFEEVVYAIATAFYIPILIGSFLKNKLVARVSFLFDLIFSQLFLVTVVFTSQDFDYGSCRLARPAGTSCSKKHAAQSFAYLSYFFTLFALLLELFRIWGKDKENSHEKHDPRAPADAPVTSA
ncbi:hypothetical protein VTN49DRAFT_458 [Thermomyces lanuginosus]|uniref:uncharacterized protein n=1 Tax=Thermomyces lanuginosus TaxID=5541 RepID=UPI003743CB70